MRSLMALPLVLTACSIPVDKQLHIGAGSAVYAGSRAVGLSPLQSVGMCAAAGVAKEAYDATGRGSVEALDVVATIAPCAIFSAIEAHRPRQRQERIRRENVDLSPIRQAR